MIYRSEDLAGVLTDLHELLLQIDQVDNATKAKLTILADDIERLNYGNAEDTVSIAQRLEQALIISEQEHPVLTQVLTRINQLLVDIGI